MSKVWHLFWLFNKTCMEALRYAKIVISIAEGMAMSVLQSVGPHSDSNSWAAIEFCADIHGSQGMIPTDLGELLTFVGWGAVKFRTDIHIPSLSFSHHHLVKTLT